MFTTHSETGYKPLLAGITMRTLVYGEKSLLTEFHLAKDAVIPLHAHPQEQTGYLVSGRIRFTVAGETFEAAPGDAWCIHGGVQHMAEILEDSVAVEVFSPVREDYLPG
ncbi:MAG TPA: cupin domain-containing protein [Anaerolineaceae bacterium]